MLTVMTNSGEVFKGEQGLHLTLCEENSIPFDSVASCGWVVEGEIRWDDRRPHVTGMPLFPK